VSRFGITVHLDIGGGGEDVPFMLHCVYDHGGCVGDDCGGGGGCGRERERERERKRVRERERDSET
jgi:hypothetical protein